MGLGRDAQSDPDDFTVYRPGAYLASAFWKMSQRSLDRGQWLLAPMDKRSTASPTGSGDYVAYSDGGLSWSVPWIAGLYALACEVHPNITPELFWSEALKTGRTIRLKRGAEERAFGSIADPVALIARLEGLAAESKTLAAEASAAGR